MMVAISFVLLVNLGLFVRAVSGVEDADSGNGEL